MKTIGFIGLGLIGGSIAKAIRKYHEDYRLLAYDQDRETLAAAVSSNMIDAVCEEHDERFRSCDYIFLCASSHMIRSKCPQVNILPSLSLALSTHPIIVWYVENTHLAL